MPKVHLSKCEVEVRHHTIGTFEQLVKRRPPKDLHGLELVLEPIFAHQCRDELEMLCIQLKVDRAPRSLHCLDFGLQLLVLFLLINEVSI